MRTSSRIGLVAGLALAAAATFALPATAGTPATVAAPANHSDGAVFVQTDDPSGNAIVAFDRSAGGQLHQAGTYRTGGNGGVLAGSVVDHLASQGSIAYDRVHALLYVVNAGSNSISVFGVHGDHLTRHQVIGSGGAFPVSIAVHGNLLYVLNARNGGTIQGFVRLGNGLVRISSWHRPLGLDATETPEFTSTPGQVAFTPDGSKLVVTTKNNGNDIDVFALHGFAGPAHTGTQLRGRYGAVRGHVRRASPPGGRRGRHERAGHVHTPRQRDGHADRFGRDRTGGDVLDRRRRLPVLRLQRW